MATAELPEPPSVPRSVMVYEGGLLGSAPAVTARESASSPLPSTWTTPRKAHRVDARPRLLSFQLIIVFSLQRFPGNEVPTRDGGDRHPGNEQQTASHRSLWRTHMRSVSTARQN